MEGSALSLMPPELEGEARGFLKKTEELILELREAAYNEEKVKKVGEGVKQVWTGLEKFFLHDETLYEEVLDAVILNNMELQLVVHRQLYAIECHKKDKKEKRDPKVVIVQQEDYDV